MKFVLPTLLSLILTISNSFTIDTTGILSTNVTIRMNIDADRTYYIAALEIDWDYAFNGSNPFTDIPVNEDESASTYTAGNTVDRIGSVYRKCLYREFTDSTFTTMTTLDDDWKHLGLLGPVVRGIVDERIKIVFYNNCSYNFSMHPHGVVYNKLSEGSLYKYNDPSWSKPVSEGGQYVPPGLKWVYIWDIREEFNYLSPNEFSSKFWFYHSHINEPDDTNSGLVGPILITKKGYETSINNPKPKDIDREFITLFNVFDENSSWYLKLNLLNRLNFSNININTSTININEYYNNYIDEFDYNDDDFIESNKMHSMNGFSWNTMSKYLSNNIKLGERIRWYIGAMGTEVDLHTAHWHGNIIIESNNYFSMHDVVMLLPAYTTQVDMITDNPGTWFYHCHVNDHVEAGMIAMYTVMNDTCNNCYGNTHDMFIDSDNNNGGDTNSNNSSNSGNSGSSTKVIDKISDKFNDSETWIIVGIACLVNVLCLSGLVGIYYICTRAGFNCCGGEYTRKNSNGPYQNLL